MTTNPSLPPVGHLLLARMLVAPEAGATTTQLLKDIKPLLDHRGNSASIADLIDETIAHLADLGLIARTKKGKTERLALPPEGRRATLEWLGLSELPPKATWAGLKKTHLLARALGLAPPSPDAAKRLGLDTGFKAAILKSRHLLPLSDYPTLPDATDALAWKLIGLEGRGPITKEAILKAAFNKALGDHPQADSKKALNKLISMSVNARKDDANELRLAVLKGWLDAEPAPSRPTLESAFDLSTFAAQVVALARSSPTGRFGDNKVFVVHAWHALREVPAFRGIPLDEFKRRLAEANQARLLDLSRADLVGAMDPDDVRESEIRHLGATFHFVRI